MTVKELIDKLSDYPPDLEVKIAEDAIGEVGTEIGDIGYVYGTGSCVNLVFEGY